MEFHSSLHSDIDKNKNHNLEHEGIYDDDDFYAELRRQILLLTADDEDEDFLETKSSDSIISASKHGLSGFTRRSSSSLQPGSYFSCWESETTNYSVPTWLANLWRNSNGTGVFIPQIVNSKSRYRPGRRNKERRKIYKHMQTSNYEVCNHAKR